GMLRRVVLRGIFPSPGRLRLLALGGRLYQRSGLQELVRRAGALPKRLKEAEALMPAPSERPFKAPPGEGFRAPAPAKYRVGLQLVEMKDADHCCGSAGIYNLTQPDLSLAFMRQKSENIAATGARTVVSGNPGCMIQLQAGLRQRAYSADVKHIVELLDEAYQ